MILDSFCKRGKNITAVESIHWHDNNLQSKESQNNFIETVVVFLDFHGNEHSCHIFKIFFYFIHQRLEHKHFEHGMFVLNNETKKKK